VELPDRTGDDEYLAALTSALPRVSLTRALIWSSISRVPTRTSATGSDGFALTFDGLARRDSIVLDLCREVGLPVVVTIAGGYGTRIEETVDVHVTTARIAARYAIPVTFIHAANSGP
jgi:acetoin utilization deacetylase AcuC-like enzyme